MAYSDSLRVMGTGSSYGLCKCDVVAFICTCAAALPLSEQFNAVNLFAFVTIALASIWGMWPDHRPDTLASGSIRRIIMKAADAGKLTPATKEIGEEAEAGFEESRINILDASPLQKEALEASNAGSQPVYALSLSGMAACDATLDMPSGASDELGDISASFDLVTCQLHLLATNAAIEAMRAGELGKDFGVIAREIQKIADQSDSMAARMRSVQVGICMTSRSVAVSPPALSAVA